MRKRIDYLLACAALDVVGEPVEPSLGVVNGVLRSTELRGHAVTSVGVNTLERENPVQQ